MFLKSLRNLKNSLSFHLTLWYAAVFSISVLFALSIFYYRIFSITMELKDQDLTGEIKEFAIIMTNGGLDHVKRYMKVEFESDEAEREETVFRLISDNGRVLATEATNTSIRIGYPPQNIIEELMQNRRNILQTIKVPGQYHEFRTIYSFIGPGLILQVASSLEESDNYLNLFKKLIFLLFIPIILLSGVIGWFLARHALKGVEEVTQTALDITSGAHDIRVHPKRRAYEVERLANAFNAMLDRIQALIKVMREMSDNIAHDLRSPLTRIRGIAEMALMNEKEIGEYQKMAANTVEECDNLIAMINTMLDITEMESGTGNSKIEPISPVDIIRNACELFQPLADEKGIQVMINLPEMLMINGDRSNIQRLVTNILENSIKYTPSGGSVKISLSKTADTVNMMFEDTGVGIAESELPKTFDRFYRCDKSRTEPGIGLGLSLAKAIAKAHRGHIQVYSQLNKGTTFIVTLPV